MDKSDNHISNLIHKIKSNLDYCKKDIINFKADALVLVDYPGFNLRLAKKLFPLSIPITYFILPQAWAWKEGRVKILKRFIDQSISIFPFENDWYKRHGLRIDYFGHPFVDIEHFNEI